MVMVVSTWRIYCLNTRAGMGWYRIHIHVDASEMTHDHMNGCGRGQVSWIRVVIGVDSHYVDSSKSIIIFRNQNLEVFNDFYF